METHDTLFVNPKLGTFMFKVPMKNASSTNATKGDVVCLNDYSSGYLRFRVVANTGHPLTGSTSYSRDAHGKVYGVCGTAITSSSTGPVIRWGHTKINNATAIPPNSFLILSSSSAGKCVPANLSGTAGAYGVDHGYRDIFARSTNASTVSKDAGVPAFIFPTWRY